jgi:hypothetical protein
MTLDERLQITYPDGAPANVVAFLKGERVGDAQSISLSIQAQAESAFKHDAEWQIKLGFLTGNLDRRRLELAEAESELSAVRLCTWPPERLIEKVNSRNAFALAVERIESETARTESEYSAVMDLARHWKTLSDLAMARVRNEIPSAVLASMFNVTPQKMVSAARRDAARIAPMKWYRALKEWIAQLKITGVKDNGE